MSYNVSEIRKLFPILNEKVNNKPLVYLDNAATTQKPIQVIEKINYMYKSCNANVHRGVHYLSNKATDEMEAARVKVQKFINAKHEEELIFTKGATEAINLVASSFGEAFINEGDEIIVSEMEHHSNLVPWQMLCKRKNAKMIKLPMNDAGELKIEELDNLISSRTKLIAIGHVSNALGTINPIKSIIKKAREKNIFVLIDGAQAVQHLKVDVQDLDCDFYAFSGHKMYAPTGIGALYAKKEILDKMPPYHGGGEMIKKGKVDFISTEYADAPFKFEAGTPNYVGIASLGAAIDFLNDIGIENIANYEENLLKNAMELLKPIENIRFIGTAKEKCSVISFMIGEAHPYDIGVLLDQMGIAIRTGTHCTELIMKHFNIPGTARISFGMYSTIEEIEIVSQALKRLAKML
ncbi:MAG: cysteine desulfurase [Bacteroidales bacterium]|nr:cysteine desulfurase [Bacteroidales bacterium]